MGDFHQLYTWQEKTYLQTFHSYSYLFASPEECKLMGALAQINLSLIAVRSRGERSRLQQGNNGQISCLFFSYFNLFS